MKREINRWLAVLMLAAVGILVVGAPAFCQEQTYEYGRVVEVDERGEALDYYMEGDYYVEEDPDHLPWNPFLSPWMFCLDCLISRAVKISDHYNQMAAERYFAESETCLDIPLGYDPCSTGLRYTLLSPFYAACPDMLVGGGWVNRLKHRVGFGGAPAGYSPYGNYGLSAPMPSVATQGPNGPTLMTPPGAPMAP
ncbi:MAG: hypothetical protein KC931_25910, partial [Candidatus Omnitrophica bacterium]|nr:hypothetical protein [Candidatus Omnitrophota bacterium]